MHAHLINYAFKSLFLNTIDYSLGIWIYKLKSITYCINKKGFICVVLFSAFFPISLFRSLTHFSRHFFLPVSSLPVPFSIFFSSFFNTLPPGFNLLTYLLGQTSSPCPLPLYYMVQLNYSPTFVNYISYFLLKFPKISIIITCFTFLNAGFCTKKKEKLLNSLFFFCIKVTTFQNDFIP